MFSLKTHGILDYTAGGALVLCPFFFGFADLDVARNVFVLCGFFMILYSLFTKYEYGAIQAIPIGVHMTLDVLVGGTLFFAPWVLDYRDFLTAGQEYLHYVLGLGAFALVGFTREKTEADKRHHGIHGPTAAMGGRL
jgi:hypothetical protein